MQEHTTKIFKLDSDGEVIKDEFGKKTVDRIIVTTFNALERDRSDMLAALIKAKIPQSQAENMAKETKKSWAITLQEYIRGKLSDGVDDDDVRTFAQETTSAQLDEMKSVDSLDTYLNEEEQAELSTCRSSAPWQRGKELERLAKSRRANEKAKKAKEEKTSTGE